MGPLERGRDGELEAVQRRNRILLEDIMRMSIEFGALCENQNKYCLCHFLLPILPFAPGVSIAVLPLPLLRRRSCVV